MMRIIFTSILNFVFTALTGFSVQYLIQNYFFDKFII